MDVTNRVLIIGGALLSIFAVLVVILLAWGAPDESIERISDLAGYLGDHNDNAAKLILTFGGLILVLLAAIVIIYEVAPPDTGTLKVQKVGAGEARIGTDEIALRLEEELRAVPQLRHVQATVLGRGQKADVKLDLHVGAETDLSATAEEACRRARELIEGRMGVTLTGPPQAQMHYRELRVSGEVGAAAQRPPEAEPAPAAAPVAPSKAPGTAPGLTGWERLPAEQPRERGAAPSPFGTPAAAEEPVHEATETQQEDRPAGA